MWNHTFKTNFIICLSMSLGTRFVSCATSKTSILTLYKQDEAIWPLYTIPRITARATVHRLPSLHPTLPYWSFSVRHLLTMAQDYSLKLVHKGNQIRLKLKLFCSQHFTFFFFFFYFLCPLQHLPYSCIQTCILKHTNMHTHTYTCTQTFHTSGWGLLWTKVLHSFPLYNFEWSAKPVLEIPSGIHITFPFYMKTEMKSDFRQSAGFVTEATSSPVLAGALLLL